LIVVTSLAKTANDGGDDGGGGGGEGAILRRHASKRGTDKAPGR